MIQIKQILKETQLLQRTLSEVSRIFVSINASNFEAKVQQAFQVCGESVQADRVYIFKYDYEKETTSNTYEWCASDIEPQIDELQDVPFEAFPEWLTAHTKGDYIYVEDVLALPEDDDIRLILEPQGVRSLITLPMMIDDYCYGFIGFDSVKSVHHYSEMEIMLLSELSTVFLVAVERKQAEELLLHEKERFRITLLSLGEGVIATNHVGEIVVINEVAQKIIGVNETDSLGKQLNDIFVLIDQKSNEVMDQLGVSVFYSNITLHLSEEHMLRCLNGNTIPIQGQISPILDEKSKVSGVVVVFRDYSEQLEREKEIQYLSFHDHLTGLYNRRYMDDSLNRIDTKRNLPISVIMIDINDLKAINDNFGHHQGDQYILETATVLRDVCRSDDVIARMGGDEFQILLPKTDYKTAVKIKDRILERVKDVFPANELELFAIGVSTKNNEQEDISIVMKMADINMYQHKMTVKNLDN